MKQLLYVDCNIRLEKSRTKQLADVFLENVSDDYEIVHLNLMEEPLQPQTGKFYFDREELLKEGNRTHERFRYAHQIANADVVVMAAPFWDLSFPALLKIYIENCSVDGITFESDETGLHGLCKGKLVYLTTRGGIYKDPTRAQDVPYLKAIQEFLGFTSFDYVAADGMDITPEYRKQSLDEAKKKAAELAKTL